MEIIPVILKYIYIYTVAMRICFENGIKLQNYVQELMQKTDTQTFKTDRRKDRQIDRQIDLRKD